MQVLQVLGNGAFGGGATVVLELSCGLVARGIDVTIASQAGSYVIDKARACGIPAVELDFSRRVTLPAAARHLREMLRGRPRTIVHAHGTRAGLPSVLLSKSVRQRLAYTVHGFHYRAKPAGVRHIARRIERFCIRRAAQSVFVCDHDKNLAAEDDVLPERASHSVIYNGGLPGTIETEAGEPAFDVAFLGRLHPQKNPLLLVDILVALKPLRPSLGIIGGGDLEDALRQRALAAGVADQMTFLGALPHLEAQRWLRRARVLVLPSRFEGLPLAVIEAMHARVPAVASAVGGVPELIEHGASGFLVANEDPARYADHIRPLLADEGARRAMGERAWRKAQEQFSLATFLDRHVSLYRQLAAQAVVEPRRVDA